MAGDGIDNGFVQPPQSHEIGAQLSMRAAETFGFQIRQRSISHLGPLQDLGIGLGEILRENQFAHIVENARGEGLGLHRAGQLLDGADGPGALAGRQAVMPKRIQPECVDSLRIELRKNLGAEHQGLDRVGSQQRHRFLSIPDPMSQTEECGIDQL